MFAIREIVAIVGEFFDQYDLLLNPGIGVPA